MNSCVAQDGKTAAILSAEKEHDEVCAKLVELGADPNCSDTVRDEKSICL